jgi:ribosomal protein S18 acetylase RimI-like enzyme
VNDVQIRELGPENFSAALELVTRAMGNNPLHVRILGDDPVRHVLRVERLQGALLRSVVARGELLGAEGTGGLAGILGMAGRRPRPDEAVKLVLAILARFPPGVTLRTAWWLGQWVKRLPGQPFWHVGPVAVDVHLQRKGIGSALMRAFCERMDKQGSLAYLETDKPKNVAFYRKFGFEVVDEAVVLGVPNWFMARQAQH